MTEWQNKKKETLIHPYLKEKVEWGMAPYVHFCAFFQVRTSLHFYDHFAFAHTSHNKDSIRRSSPANSHRLHPYLKEKVEWGMAPYVQAMLLARYLRGDLDSYPVFLWK